MGFWIAIVAMTVAALAFVLRPLLGNPARSTQRRAETALRAAHAAGALSDQELKQKLSQLPPATESAGPPRALASTLSLLLPGFALGLYFWLGEPRALDAAALERSATPRSASGAADEGGGAPPPSMEQAVSGLAERLRNEPDNFDGWLLLGRAYKNMERFAEAREALANTVRIAPNDPDALVEYAEAIALSSPSRRIEGEARSMLERALDLNAEHQRGLWLLGIAAMQADQPVQAVDHWERLRALIAADPDAVASLDEQIEGARQAAGMPPAANSTAVADAPSSAATTAATGGGPRLTVRVDISPELKAKLSANDVLFVYARAANGSKMPLAIERLPASQLPVTIILDDSDSMMPELKLSVMPQVVVGARVSKSGQAVPQPGDFEVFSAPIPNTRAEPLDLLIDTVLP